MLWDAKADKLVLSFELCLRLNEAYHSQYSVVKEKLAQSHPESHASSASSKLFDFDEQKVFGEIDVFCRRLIKLVGMFGIISDFESLAAHKLEGMEPLNASFKKVVSAFRGKKHNLLEFTNSKFDRDFVEFNVKISRLEGELLTFVNKTFEKVSSIAHSLTLLSKFKAILNRDAVRSSLDEKLAIIFRSYGQDLEAVQVLYEKHKQAPPFPRNMPPVAGNISWCRHLLKRIEDPMKEFEKNPNLLAAREGKKIVKMYNKVARTLVAFEYLWFKAWCESIETSTAGLQATLVVRHPEDDNLYVNLDPEILQLIREARCLDRIGIEVPEAARIVLEQEERIKVHNERLVALLKQYDTIAKSMIPVTTSLLRPHINDIEYQLRPGMITLTWTSMNIDSFVEHVSQGLGRFEELVRNVNDIVENRVEKSLKEVSKSLLVDLPKGVSFTLDDFVEKQENCVGIVVKTLQDQNMRVEGAVEDLIHVIRSYPIDPHLDGVSQEDVENLRKHYNHFMYQALLNCSKNSLNAVKKRMSSSKDPQPQDHNASVAGVAGVDAAALDADPSMASMQDGGGGEAGGPVLSLMLDGSKPFFEVDVRLALPHCKLSPSLDEVQMAINLAAKAVLTCNRQLFDWGQQQVPKGDRLTFFRTIAKDIEITSVVPGQAAVATYYAEGSLQAKGGSPVSNYLTRVTIVFVKEGDEWKRRAAHWSPIVGGAGTTQTVIDKKN